MSPEPTVEIHTAPPHPLAPWFDLHRENRQRERDRAARWEGQKPSRAVFTMVRDEAFHLPIWLNYYSRFFAPEDIHVLDHDSQDGSTGDPVGYQLTRVHQEEFDSIWQRETVEAKQRELLKTHDMVLFTDVDELIVPRPSLGDLGTYMDGFDEPFVHCLGYEILHLPDRGEGPLDPGQKVTGQRGYWFQTALYNKLGIATEPVVWHPGFHRREDYHFNPDPDLIMVHLHRVDFDQCLARHLARSRDKWSERRIERGWGAHNRITDPEEFRHWFFFESGIPNYPIEAEEIGPEWTGAF